MYSAVGHGGAARPRRRPTQALGCGAASVSGKIENLSGDMQRRSVVSATMGLHDDLYVLIERHQKTQKTLHGELAEFPAQHFGYVGLADAQQTGHFDLFQTPLSPDRIDFEHKLRFDQMFFRIRHTDILKHVTASDFVSFLAHRSLSCAICLAWRSRC